MSGDAPPTPAGSLAFDRAAEFYDETRRVSDSAIALAVDLLEGELV